MKKLKITALLYIVIIITLSLLGILGNSNEDLLKAALHYFTGSDIAVGKAYFLHGMIPSTIYRIFSIMVLLYMAIKKKYYVYINFLRSKIRSDFLVLLLSFLSIFVFFLILRFPFSIYTGYYRDWLFQFSEISFFTWLLRFFSSSLISIFIISLSFAIISSVVLKTRKYFLYIPVIFFVLSILISIIYPRFITPLFFETKKISDPVLKEEIFKLTARSNINIEDIYIIHKSKYNSAANAYLAGTGAERKIFLYDTLLDKFSHKEILSIVAHEILHYKKEHMLIGILLGTLGVLIAIPLFNIFSEKITDKSIKELARAENHPQLFLLIVIFVFFTKPVENSISRKIEEQADRYSIEMTNDPQTFIEMKIKLAKINKSFLLPNPVYSWFYHTHPDVLERIRIAESYKKKGGIKVPASGNGQ